MSLVTRLLAPLGRARQAFKEDSLFRNAIYLVASTAVMSALGFGFWLFVAHLYSPSQIGVASALISITTLISNVSLLGLNAGLVRFLPRSKNQSSDINAAIIAVGLVTMLATAVYLVASGFLGIHLSLLTETWQKLAFVFLMATVSLNTLTDAVFVANRRAEYHTLTYAFFGGGRLLFPLLFIPFGAMGIFASYILAVVISLIMSLVFMRTATGYRLLEKPNWRVLHRTRKYATNNYIAGILSGLPSQIMPLFIIKHLGTADVAFFSMAWTMANLLYVIPSAATQSLLAESSHDPVGQRQHIKRTVRLLIMIVLPLVALSVLVAPYLLKIFGAQYSAGSTRIFQILALATIFVSITTVCNTVLNIKRRTSGIVLSQGVGLVVSIASVLPLLHYGLVGVGLALMLGNIASNICHAFVARYNKTHQPPTDQGTPSNAELSREDIGTVLRNYGISRFAHKTFQQSDGQTVILVRAESGIYQLHIYPQHARTEEHTASEASFTTYLAAQGLPIASLIPANNGQHIIAAKLHGADVQCVLSQYLPGKQPSQYNAPVIYEMAHLQAQMHLSGAAYGADRRAAGDNTARLAKRRRLLNALTPLRFAQKGFSHFDFVPQHVHTNGRRITAVADFDSLHYGSLIGCVYRTLTDLYDTEHDIANLHLYLTSYQQVRKLNRAEKLMLRLGLLLRYKNPRLLSVAA
ncbi:MAG TPA: oligosaccharide flippase family protein [Candidatus Saccharimonadales bacterium]|nr:oligosaccharide flippase family protein [Candidatus Saccharimonadales bacterium]